MVDEASFLFFTSKRPISLDIGVCAEALRHEYIDHELGLGKLERIKHLHQRLLAAAQVLRLRIRQEEQLFGAASGTLDVLDHLKHRPRLDHLHLIL